jgi:hypothetical protein
MVCREEKLSIVGFLRDKHRRALKKEKGVIIDELCNRIGCTRKHAIKLLSRNSVGRPVKPGRRGRPGKYQDKAFKDALRIIWRLTKNLCGRRLKGAIREWLPAVLEFNNFDDDVQTRLLSVSAATIDRILKPIKLRCGKSYTTNGGFRDQIPIQGNIWDIKEPGYMETDTAAHCGGSMHGEFINTLTMVDIATLWTETRAVFGRGSNAVLDGVKDIEIFLPFSIKGYDADNGGEVLNMQLYNYFVTERLSKGISPVMVTRSRAYKKNDQAHVEQRNDAIARKYLGYERLDFSQLVPSINHYYANLVCPFVNHFLPSFKLSEKQRIKSRTKRIYAAPVTPYQRIIDSPFVALQKKKRLKAIHNSLNPVRLSAEIDKTRSLIDLALKRLKQCQKIPINLPQYSLSGSLLELNNTVSNYQIFHHTKILESFSPHNFRYDDL